MPIRKILIVDDSPTDRQFLVEALSRQGYECVCAASGEESIARSKTDRPDLILMDIVMPGMSGFQAMRAIRRDAQTGHIPVVLCSSKRQDTDRVWGLRQGARDYVTKPIDARELIGKIKQMG